MRKASEQIDWDDLRFFLAVMRSGQISYAARQLSVDHATVARRIDHLERTMKTLLFERGRAGYRATPSAQRLLQSAEAAEAAILTAESDISGGNLSVTGKVRIGSPDGFGTMFLAPRINKLRERHPGLDIELVMTMGRPFRLSSREVDIAVSLEMPPRGRLYGRKLADFHLGLYASAGYLNSHEPINSTADLQNHEFVGYVEEFIIARDFDFLSIVGQGLVSRFRSSSWLAQALAAANDVGIAVLPPFLVPDHIELYPVLEEEVRLERSFFLLMHEDSKDIARVRAVTKFIYDIVNQNRHVFEPGAKFED